MSRSPDAVPRPNPPGTPPAPKSTDAGRRERLVLALAEAIGAGIDPDATVAAAAAVLHEATDADHVVIALVDHDHGVLADVMTTRPELRATVEALRGAEVAALPLWSAITSGGGLLVAPTLAGTPHGESGARLHAGAALGLVLRDVTPANNHEPAPLAVAICCWRTPRESIDPDSVRIARTLGGQAAIAISGAHSRAQARALTERLSDLVTWAGQLSSAEQTRSVVAIAARAASELLSAPFVGVWSIGGAAHHPSGSASAGTVDAELATLDPGPDHVRVLSAASTPRSVAAILGERGLAWPLLVSSPDGACRILAGRATPPGPIEERVALLLADLIAESVRRAQAYEDMSRQAVTDALTGLGNRAAFETTLPQAIALSLRYGRPLAFAVADLDDLRIINERGGHPAGDECLRAVAAAIRGELRSSDSAFRIGGDEFALIFPETTAEAAAAVLERVAQGAKRRHSAVGLTVGVAQCPDHGTNGEVVYRSADAALYRGKSEGRGHVTVAEERPPDA